MTIFDRAKLAVQLSLDNYEQFLDAKAKVEAAYVAVAYMAQVYAPVFAADAASALSDDELTEQLEAAFSATQEEAVYGARFDLSKIREVIAWIVANKELIALLVKFI